MNCMRLFSFMFCQFSNFAQKCTFLFSVSIIEALILSISLLLIIDVLFSKQSLQGSEGKLIENFNWAFSRPRQLWGIRFEKNCNTSAKQQLTNSLHFFEYELQNEKQGNSISSNKIVRSSLFGRPDRPILSPKENAFAYH